jgi:hypothetical protein
MLADAGAETLSFKLRRGREDDTRKPMRIVDRSRRHESEVMEERHPPTELFMQPRLERRGDRFE